MAYLLDFEFTHVGVARVTPREVGSKRLDSRGSRFFAGAKSFACRERIFAP